MTPRRWALLALALVGAGAALVWQADPQAASGADAGADAFAPDAAGASAPRLAKEPPPGVPATWKRYEHVSLHAPGAGFGIFLPSGYGDVDRVMEDGEGGRFRGPAHVLSYEFDGYAPFAEARTDAGEVSLAREEATVNGRPAVLQTLRASNGEIFSSVHFALGSRDGGEPLALTIFGTCDTVEACADVWAIGRTVEIY